MSDARDHSDAHAVASIGVEEIDRQHRVLLERWRLLQRDARAGNGAGVRSNLWFLRQYFAEHFATEERLMAEVGYPAARKHERAHCELLVQLGELQLAVSQGRDPWARGQLGCVEAWVKGHLVEHDGPMGRFISARRRIRDAAGGPVDLTGHTPLEA